jgi:hypothetical protein
MKAILLATALCVTGAAAATAQEFSIGPGGVTVGRDRDRGYDRERWDRRHHDRDFTTGSVRGGCRYVTITKENDDGDTVTRRIRRCD